MVLIRRFIKFKYLVFCSPWFNYLKICFLFKLVKLLDFKIKLYYVYFSALQYSQQPASGVAYSHPTTVASYTVHQAPVAAHTVTAAYAPAAATVAVARPAPVAVAAAATAAAYGGYPTAHTATDYGYTQRQQEAPPPPPPATTQNYQVRKLLVSIALTYRLQWPQYMT